MIEKSELLRKYGEHPAWMVIYKQIEALRFEGVRRASDGIISWEEMVSYTAGFRDLALQAFAAGYEQGKEAGHDTD